MMSPGQYDEEAIFHAALEKGSPREREAYLQSACRGNTELLGRLQALVEAAGVGNDFLDDPDSEGETSEVSVPSEGPGATVDRYKLLEKIGEGGMAVVYMAEQQQPIRRKVALKIIKLGMDTKQVIARFEAERQALALMDHPHIAKVFDAGTTETGRPYFVMELVRGVSITEYCDQNSLSTDKRLQLFIEVCNAVQHAHQKGIIHRDIKPSNVMVTRHDGNPVPKVIDFGIAKATNQHLTEKTLFTRHAHVIGTPAYMSPEQAELSDLDTDTRSDVYSLGVLLYELLTGTTPFSEEELRKAGYVEMQRVIREQEPAKPSTKLSTLGETLTDVAQCRGATPDLLRKAVRGDLDWIVMKCLEKDRTRRYDTANGLATDVARHLSDEPVVARPPSAAYRLQRAWRRNKAVFMAAGMVAASLIIGISLSLWQAIEARRNEISALQRAYDSDMSLAFHALQECRFGRVQESVRQHTPEVGEPDFRGWEWRYAWAQSQSDAVRIWNTPAEMGEVFAVRISPDQRYLVSSEFDPGLTSPRYVRRLWDYRTRHERKDVHLPGGSARGFVFSHSGKYLALHRNGGNNVHEIHIYDTTTWELETVIPSTDNVRSLSFSLDDQTLGAVAPPVAILWDWRQRTLLHEWPVEGRWVYLDLAFFPDGRRLAIGGAAELKVVDVVTGDVVHREPVPDDGIPALAISPDGRYVAIASGYEVSDIGVLNAASWQHEPPLTGHSGWVTSLTFSRDGERLISSSADNTIRIWDMKRRETTRVLKGHQSEVFFLSLASDESRAVTAGKDKLILEWDLEAPESPFRETVLDEKGIRQVEFSADGRAFYTINERGSIGMWDATMLSRRQSLSSELGPESSILLSPNGNQLIAGTGSGELCVVDAASLQIIVRRNVPSQQILPVGFWDDGKSLVALESDNEFPWESDNHISLWNTETWQMESRVQTERRIGYYHPKNYCAIPPGSGLLLYPSGADLAWWDLRQSKEIAKVRVNYRRSGVISISPTEPLLASAARGDFIFLWNWRTQRPAGQLRGPGAFLSVAFSPDGRRLVSGGTGKGAILLWDVATRQEIAQFGTNAPSIVRSVQFSPDGNVICAVDQAGLAYFWRAPSFEEINAFEAQQRRTERR
jgi:serine/threonine protein kinase/WD40 repeat protein